MNRSTPHQPFDKSTTATVGWLVIATLIGIILPVTILIWALATIAARAAW